MRQAGINRADIAFALKRASDGMPLGKMNLNDELIPIQLRATSQTMASLETLPVRSLLGIHSVPLGQVIDGFDLVSEESMIWRRNRVKNHNSTSRCCSPHYARQCTQCRKSRN